MLVTLLGMVMLVKLLQSLKANLPMLAIGAAVALITRFVESARQMKQVNDEIDEQITTLYGASQQMTDYQSKIEKNNELIKSNGKEITDNKKRQEALNEALNSNSGIYAKLKNEYPQIAEQLKQNANGTIENTDALKAYNEQLELVERMEDWGEIIVIRPQRPMEVDRLCRDVNKLERLYEEGFSQGELFCLSIMK